MSWVSLLDTNSDTTRDTIFLFEVEAKGMGAILREDGENTRQAVRNTLGKEAFRAAVAKGQAMSPDQAVVYALDQ